jgi:hypothetical protein
MSQLDDNLGSVSVNLTASEVAELDGLTQPAKLVPHAKPEFSGSSRPRA